MTSFLKKALVASLYALPVVFFLVCYFLITVSGEDILQGAGTAPHVLQDLVGAFRHNSRLSDMYAWAVVNFYDYQYSFGVDTIFRLIDTIMATGMIYLLVNLMLGRRLKFQLSDALLFAFSFLVIFLTPHGHVFYRGFSMIHNYLVIALATLGFGLPFVRWISGQKLPKVYQFWPFALLMGLIFGMSSNVAPIAFLITYLLIKCFRWWQGKSAKVWRLSKTELALIIGMVLTLSIAYLFGPGVSSYAGNPVYTGTYDYVAFSDLGQNFFGSVVRLLKHFIINCGRTFGPILVIWLGLLGVAVLFSRLKRQTFRLLPTSANQRQLILVLLSFAIVYLGISSQIIMPVRLCLPAYLGLIVITGLFWQTWWQPLLKSSALQTTLGIVMSLAIFATILLRGYFALDYRTQAEAVFQKIQASEETVVCVAYGEVVLREVPLLHFAQEETFADWVIEAGLTVDGKTIQRCN